MKHLAPASLIALAVAGAPLAAQDSTPGTFRLPTPSPTPTGTDVQGPVDPDAPILTRPRAPTPAPTPSAAPTPTPSPAPRPAATPIRPPETRRDVPPPSNSSLPPRFTPPAASSAGANPAPATVLPTASPTSEPAAPVAVPTAPATTPAAPAEAASGWSGWLLALLALAVAAVVGGLVWFRRARAGDPDVAPVIARPRTGAAPAPAAGPAPLPEAPSGQPLLIEARAVRLSRSMVYATLHYELVATNRSGQPLENVTFGGDLVTAHARVPADQQLADPAMPLAPMQAVARLEPGESVRFTGDLKLPVNQIRPIPHGSAVVYVPLLRVRAEAQGMVPYARTFVVGLLPSNPSERLQPFRLDEMPQIYHGVGQRALD